MEMQKNEEMQSEKTTDFLESILGRLRQISRDVLQLRISQESLERKVDALHHRLDAEFTAQTRPEEAEECHHVLESNKENAEGKRALYQGEDSSMTVSRTRKKKKIGESQSEDKVMTPIFSGPQLANVERAVRSVQEIQVRQRQGRFPKTLRASRGKRYCKDPKGYWKLDFTDTSTQSP